ncbi:MAG TPA: PAS domain-containing protein, partial [Gemmatimonadaceae bacterium]|nr:PAS domain-containing protein [Gemmatimonadaceae bacterium]
MERIPLTNDQPSSPLPRPGPHADADAERVHQQELLERQAVELELQAQELQRQVEELAQANEALRAAQAETAAEHRRTLDAIEARLRQASQLDAALAAVPVALAIIDRDLRYIKVNATTATMTAWPIEAHTGRTLREINPQLAPELEAMMRRVIETGEPVTGFHVVRPTPHARGGKIDIVMQMAPFYDADGAIAGLCSTATDVTEWRAFNEQLARTQQVETAGRLAAGIAHDFNNLLTIIGSYCDLMLLELPAGAPHRPDVEEIRGAADRATTLARRMLSTASHHAVAPKPVDLRSVVLGAVDILEQAARKKVRLVFDCPDDAGVVTADPTQLEQVLLNLVINAVDAMPDGGTVTVAARAVTFDAAQRVRTGDLDAGAYAELTVGDTGSGMPPETLARIFEPFFTTKP